MIKYVCDFCNKEVLDSFDLYDCRIPFRNLENNTCTFKPYELCSSCLDKLNNYINSCKEDKND